MTVVHKLITPDGNGSFSNRFGVNKEITGLLLKIEANNSLELPAQLSHCFQDSDLVT